MSDPVQQFEEWFAEARAAGVPQAEAMALATADAQGRPSVRMVLLRGWGDRGFEFYTNRQSRKGSELAVNPHAALTLYWQPLGRAVRAAGPVRAMSAADSVGYWNARPPASQASATVSEQSRPLVGSRQDLEERQERLLAESGGASLPLPDFWGGYRLLPDYVEFWEHREDRLHHRVLHTRTATGWRSEELQP